MSFIDYKTANGDIVGNRVADLPDRPGEGNVTAADLKARFDYLPLLIAATNGKFNALIDYLAEKNVDLAYAKAEDADEMATEASNISNANVISSVVKTATSGLIDTYTITLAGGATFSFTITNGAKGDTGEQGEVGVADVTQETFTVSDARWSTITNGFKIEITTAKNLIGGVYKLKGESGYEEIIADVEYGSGTIIVYCNEKIDGCVYLI